jgi:hypothetical protein
MQTKPLHLASGIPKLAPEERGTCCPKPTQENPMPTLMPKMMPETAAIALPSSVTLFGRFMALVDRALMAHARIANRNGDLPRFGL